jgi:hypothetical protein
MKRQCAATVKATGERCKLPPVRGARVCWKHGGKAPQVKAAGARRVAEAKAVRVLAKYEPDRNTPVDVLAELRSLVSRVTSFERFAHQLVGELSAGDWQRLADPQTAAVISMWSAAADKAARLLTDVARLGLLERAVQAAAEWQEAVERARARRIIACFEAVVARVGLTDDQRELARKAMAVSLLTGPAEAADG